jgi:rod shape determining protein RodA
MKKEKKPGGQVYFLDKSKGISFFRRFDYIFFLCVVALSVFGLIVLESATRTMLSGKRIMLVQTASIALGIVLALCISAIDYRILKLVSIFLHSASILFLMFVLIRGTGLEEVGSKSWLLLPGGISFQPAEVAKITFIIMVADLLEKIREGQGRYNLLKLALVAAIPVALVMMQPDYGTAVVFFVILASMLYIWGIRYRYILISAGAAVAALPVVWFFFLKDDKERMARITEFLFPGHDPSGASYQVLKAKMAIGSGRLFGSGLGKGIQTQNPVEGIPVKESDCIFAVIGEELGFIGTCLIVVLVSIILLRCLYIASRSPDLFGEYIVIGIFGMFAFHFFENIGMNIGLMPVTGIPLPFVSAGGTAIVSNFIAVGLVLSVAIRRKATMFNSDR